MKTYLADTNIFIRFFTGDDKDKAHSVLQTMKRVKAKEIELIVTEAVLIEIIHILSSKRLYNLGRGEIKKLLVSILVLENIKVDRKRLYFQALDIYIARSIDFTDCVLAVRSLHSEIDGAYSYDEDFDKIDGVVRVEEVRL
jgi:predicted nucleic-acid-binding protein